MTPILGWLSLLWLIHNSIVKGEDHSLDDGSSRHPSSICRFLCKRRTNPLGKVGNNLNRELVSSFIFMVDSEC